MTYYNRQMNRYLTPPDLPYVENQVPAGILDTIVLGDAVDLRVIPSNSIHLVITSPPYNIGKAYDNDLDRDEFKLLLKKTFRECYRVLVPGGRICVNVANLGRRPYIVLSNFVAELMFKAGFYMRGELIWDKGQGQASTAWGSWCLASNPTLRDIHEYILIASKPPFKLVSCDRQSTITKDEFLEYTKSIWHIAPASAKRIGHPAPFPIELPLRLIKLFSFEGNVVLDPFVGSGTTCIAAVQAGRHYIGIDNSEQYVQLARERIKATKVI